MWENKHGANEHAEYRNDPSLFAQKSIKFFVASRKVLELGCGVGRDAVYFQENGFEVTATDFSETVISQNRQDFSDSGVKFEVLNIEQLYEIESSSYENIYANLSLHYYSDKITRQIFGEIARILKSGGTFAFSCKSKDAVRTDSAQLVEKNFYVGKNGHALHVFSEEYTKNLLAERYDIEHMDVVYEETYSRACDVVECIARKK